MLLFVLTWPKLPGFDKYYHIILILQGGVATATKKCPLWSDTKALHKAELLKVAQETRETLAKSDVKLDVDPLKDIVFVPVKETNEEVAISLFNKWVAVSEEVEKLANGEARTFLKKRLELVLKMLNAEAMLERKKEVTAIMESIVTQLRVCQETGELRGHVWANMIDVKVEIC